MSSALLLLACLLAADPAPLSLDGEVPAVVAVGHQCQLRPRGGEPPWTIRADLTPAGAESVRFGPYEFDGTSPALTVGLSASGMYTLTAEVGDAAGNTVRERWTTAAVTIPTLDPRAFRRRLPHTARAAPRRLVTVAEVSSQPAPAQVTWLLAPALLSLTDEPAAHATLPDPDQAAEPPPADLVALAVGWDLFALGAPPEVVGSRVRWWLDHLAGSSTDVICLAPLPGPGATAADLRRGLATAHWLREACGDRAWVVDSTAAVWPTGVASLEQAAAFWPANLVGQPGGWVDWATGCQFRLTEAILAGLTAEPAAPALAVGGAVGGGAVAGEVVLVVRNQTAEPQQVWLDLPCPDLPAWPSPLALLPGGHQTLALPWPRSPADLPRALHGQVGTASGLTVPLSVPLPRSGVDAWLAPGRHLVGPGSGVPLWLSNRAEVPRQGTVRWRNAALAVTWRAGAGETRQVDLPVALPAVGAGQAVVEGMVLAEDQRIGFRAALHHAATLVAELGRPRLDGDLADWAEGRWYHLGEAAQVALGGDRWEGPADASLQFACRADADGLWLALLPTDDQPTAGDWIEFWVDPRPAELVGQPGPTRRFRLPLHPALPDHVNAAAWPAEPIVIVARAGVAIECLLPWRDLGVTEPGPGRLIGLEVALRDADEDGEPTWLTATGDAWGWAVADRLGLLRLGRTARPLPSRVLIPAPD